MQGQINLFGKFAANSGQRGKFLDRRFTNAGDAAEARDQLFSALAPYSGNFFQLRFAARFCASGSMPRHCEPVRLVANFEQELKAPVFERQL